MAVSGRLAVVVVEGNAGGGSDRVVPSRSLVARYDGFTLICRKGCVWRSARLEPEEVSAGGASEDALQSPSREP